MRGPKAKQIYLLLVVVFGVIALSVYSTYAIFTIERSSDDIVSIHTPSDLQISASTYEYKQVVVPKDAHITTDLDIYNNLADEVCYSVWYKVVGNNADKIKVYENTTDSLTTSMTIPSVTSRRISLLITNDADYDIKVNIGLTYEKNEGTCSFNIASDKSLITTMINAKPLSDTLTSNLEVKHSEASYLTYKDLTEELNLDKTYYIAKEFAYANEEFTLKESETLDLSKANTYQDYYLCAGGDKCQNLYHLKEIDAENKTIKYDKLVGYLNGESGLRKVGNNYYYYGDNPNNFIYYNCKNDTDNKTCELWRIIGFYYDETERKYLTKIIRNDYLGSEIYDENSNRWNESNIQNYLKSYKLKNDNLATELTFKEENLLSLDTNLNSIEYLNDENKAKVMLINVKDYVNTSSCQKSTLSEYDENCLRNNWLNKNEEELTMTIKYEKAYLDEETNEEVIPENKTVYYVGNIIGETSVTDKLNIRPVSYLRSRILLTAGKGTLEEPYIIK